MTPFSAHETRKLTTEARFLLEPLPDTAQAVENVNTAKRRLTRWRERAAKGDANAFVRRLHWAGLTAADARTLVQDYEAGSVSAEWTRQLSDMLLTFEGQSLDERLDAPAQFDCFDSAEPHPFEPLYEPFVAWAMAKLEQRQPLTCLTDAARTDLAGHLLRQLATLCTRTVHFEFSLYRRGQLPAFMPDINRIEGDAIYRRYLTRLWNGELRNLLLKYPVLARLITITIQQFVTNHADLLGRLHQDRGRIGSMFAVELATTPVTKIQTGLSDPHNGGCTVAVLTFANDFRIVYKPRPLGVEAAFAKLIDYTNATGALPQLRNIEMVHTDAYGWVEFIEHEACTEPSAITRYYQRSGVLLALLYLLQGTDVHRGNLKANGEFPVLIDGETILQPNVHLQLAVDDDPRAIVQQTLKEAVTRSLMLPNWLPGVDGDMFDISGLTSGFETQTHFRQLQWDHLNTDRMKQVYARVRIDEKSVNLPSLDGRYIAVEGYVDAVIAGFQQTMRFLIERKADLLAPGGVLSAFNGVSVRFVMRNTRVYASVRDGAFQPRFLRNGVVYGIELDALSRSYVQTREQPAFWPMLQSELDALYQLDIPHYMVPTDSAEFPPTVFNYLTGPAYEKLAERLHSLSDTDVALQTDIIRGAFSTRYESRMDMVQPPTLRPAQQCSISELTDRAVAIGEQLLRDAIWNETGDGASWIGLQLYKETTKLTLSAANDTLQNGVGGISLFLAALARVTGRTDFRDLAVAAWLPTRLLYVDNSAEIENFTAYSTIGGAFGLASTVYALTKVSQWTHDEALCETARLVAGHITPQKIAQDGNFDVMFGSAGAILGLAPLYDATCDPAILQTMIACGERLLDNRASDKTKLRAWALNGQLLAGFSHGAAGNAYALLRLYRASGQERFRAAAEEAIAWENTLLDEQVGNWNYLLSGTREKPEYVNRWCHGAPGIGLARIGGLELLDSAEIRRDIEIAVHTCATCGHSHTDHICCGSLGVLETLIAARQHNLYDGNELCEKLDFVLQRADQRGQFSLPSTRWNHSFQVGLFQGTSGVGYQLLRAAHPERVSSALLWQ